MKTYTKSQVYHGGGYIYSTTLVSLQYLDQRVCIVRKLVATITYVHVFYLINNHQDTIKNSLCHLDLCETVN